MEQPPQKSPGKDKLKIGSWNMATAATQPHAANVNMTSQALEDEKLDVLGICECNIFPTTNQESIQIQLGGGSRLEQTHVWVR